MTKTEEYLYKILLRIFGEKYYIFPQIHLSTLFDHKVKGQNWAAAFSHINGKSVDFVLCSKTDLRPICAIELDDYTHNYKTRAARDAEVERIFEQAKCRLARIKTSPTLSDEKIAKIILDAIKS
jgi:hypothetical protein